MANISAVDILLVALGLWLTHRLTKKPRGLPPGPKGFPLIGNAVDMPNTEEYKAYATWGLKFGPILSASVFGTNIVILNKHKDAVNLLEKKGAHYSARPVLMMGGVLSGWNAVIGLSSGPVVRQMRRIAHNAMGSKAHIAKFEGVEVEAIHSFLRRVMRDPRKLYDEIRRTAGKIILKITYDYDIKEDSDPLLEVADRTMVQFSEACNPGYWLVDLLPILQYLPSWFPGASFKTKATYYKSSLEEMATTPFNLVKDALAHKTAGPSLTGDALQRKHDQTSKEEQLIRWTAASMYAGGADTTVSSIYTFYLAMTLYPEVQRRAQSEIDAVVGTDRLPTFADRAHLPYVESIFKEVLRWHPVAPMGLPHVAVEEDQYEGYRIPKGTMVLANVWNILHDEEEYEEPFAFNPDRFMVDNGSGRPARDPREICFGFGRRICPGLHLADSSVWLSCCLSLATFNIAKSVDASGQVVEPDVKFTDGVISHPHPFECDIKPRSQKVETLLLESVN